MCYSFLAGADSDGWNQRTKSEGLSQKNYNNFHVSFIFALRWLILLLQGNLIHQENIELYKKVNLIRQEYTELQKVLI